MATADATFEDDPQFHIENNTIITSKKAITVQQMFNFLSKNLDKFRVGSQFVMVSGVHGCEEGDLLQGDDESLVQDYRMMYGWFRNHKKYGQLAKMVENRKYEMNLNSVIGVTSEEDKTQKGKFVLSKDSIMAIKNEFEQILDLEQPIVLILASCWSHRCQVADILRSTGIFTVMNVLEDGGNNTNGKMFVLDQVLQKFFNYYISINISRY